MLYYNDTMNKGVNPLPVHGRVGARTIFLAALFAKQKTKFGGGKARAGRKRGLGERNSRPARAKFSEISVRIFAKKSSDFIQKRQHATIFFVFRFVLRLAASRLGAETGQISETFFRPQGEKI